MRMLESTLREKLTSFQLLMDKTKKRVNKDLVRFLILVAVVTVSLQMTMRAKFKMLNGPLISGIQQ